MVGEAHPTEQSSPHRGNIGVSVMKSAFILGLTTLVTAFSGGWAMSESVPADNNQVRNGKLKNLRDGNFKDAYEGFSKLALDPQDDPREVGSDLDHAATCLQRLNRLDELDDFREKVIEIHKTNWRLLQS